MTVIGVVKEIRERGIDVFEVDGNAGVLILIVAHEADGHAAERLHRHVERNAHALHGTAQDHAHPRGPIIDQRVNGHRAGRDAQILHQPLRRAKAEARGAQQFGDGVEIDLGFGDG